MLDLSITSLYLMTTVISLGRVFGGKCPIESSVFCLDSCPREDITMDNLRKRCVIVVDWCCMCKRSGEIVDYLLLHCEIASALWSTIFSHLGLAWLCLEE
jgi:hypothetical protein